MKHENPKKGRHRHRPRMISPQVIGGEVEEGKAKQPASARTETHRERERERDPERQAAHEIRIRTPDPPAGPKQETPVKMGKRIEASDVPVSIPFNALEKGKDSRVVRDQTGAKAAGGLPRKAGSRCRVGTNLLESRVSFCKVAIFSTASCA